MKLEKKEFTQKKYNELIDYANENNMIIADKENCYETEEKKEPIKTLEELKEEKIEELKRERDIYKSNTFIKKGFCLLDFEPFSCYNYHNLVRLKCGWTQEDLDKFDIENEFISKFWDTKKAEIKNSTTKKSIENINTKFIKEK